MSLLFFFSSLSFCLAAPRLPSLPPPLFFPSAPLARAPWTRIAPGTPAEERLYFRKTRLSYFHSRLRQEESELSFERQSQSSTVKRWLRAAASGNADDMKAILKEDPEVLTASDNCFG